MKKSDFEQTFRLNTTIYWAVVFTLLGFFVAPWYYKVAQFFGIFTLIGFLIDVGIFYTPSLNWLKEKVNK